MTKYEQRLRWEWESSE